MKIHVFPPPLASQPQKDEPGHDNRILYVGDEIEIVVVLCNHRVCIDPRQHKEDVSKCPPSQQQAKVEVAEARMHLTTFVVGLERQSGHKRNAAKEEQDVAGIQPGERLMKINLVIGPLKLADHP